MRIAIIGAGGAPESQQLKEEGKKAGHQVDLIKYGDLIFYFDENGTKILIDEQDLSDKYDVIIPRGITRHPEEALLICEYMLKNGKYSLDARLATKRFFISKAATSFHFAQAKLPQPKTWQVFARRGLEKIIDQISYPVVVKHIRGKQSKSIYLLDSREKLEEFSQKEKIDKYIIQEFIPINKYIRVLVLGDQILGAMERTKINIKDGRIGSGVKSKKIEIPQEVASLCIKASKSEGNDFSGCDVLEDQSRYYIIEANRGPMFHSFVKVTGINVAEKLIKYLEKVII